MAKKNKKVSLKKAIFFILGVYGILAILFLTAINISVFIVNQKVLGANIEDYPDQEETFWLNIHSQNPTYFDALIELTKLKIENKETQEAFEYLQKAKAINPNSLTISDFEEQLGRLY